MDSHRTIKQGNSCIHLPDISMDRNMFVIKQHILGLVKVYGKHPVPTDIGGTWYPKACRFLEDETPYTFHSREKPNRKDDKVYQRQN